MKRRGCRERGRVERTKSSEHDSSLSELSLTPLRNEQRDEIRSSRQLLPREAAKRKHPEGRNASVSISLLRLRRKDRRKTHLNRGGNSLPLGIFPSGSLNSSKKGWVMASYAESRSPGVYSRSFEMRSIASGAVRGRKTLEKG